VWTLSVENEISFSNKGKQSKKKSFFFLFFQEKEKAETNLGASLITDGWHT